MNEEQTTAILIEGAKKSYRATPFSKERVAVADVSLSVPVGSIHGLLGPNGAGKTTSVKMLLGLVRPDAGRFEILGRPSGKPRGRAGVGFLPEQPYFPGQLKADQAMRLYGRLAGVPRTRLKKEIAEKLDAVGLSPHSHIQLSKFSRGMLQRLGIAQTLLGDPRVVVLDEPASGLDPVGQRDVRNLMLSLKEQGVTVLLSSHQLSEVEAVCDRVTIINSGEVAAAGDLSDLLSVEGQSSISVADLQDGLPEVVKTHAVDAAVSDGMWTFSVPTRAVRIVVDAIDEAGGTVVSLVPKRESLEDYFARMLLSGKGGDAL